MPGREGLAKDDQYPPSGGVPAINETIRLARPIWRLRRETEKLPIVLNVARGADECAPRRKGEPGTD